MLIAALDVRYDGDASTGQGATVIFERWKDAAPLTGAKHLEWIDLLDKETQRFKTAGEIGKLFADAGIDLNEKIATHCQSGGRASVMAFGLELMGAKDVSNSYRSWSEWGNSDDTPVVVGKPKN